MDRNDISVFTPKEAPEYKIDKITKAIREGLQISPSDNFDEDLNSIKNQLCALNKKIEQLSPNTDISAFEKNADVSSLQDYAELVKNYEYLAAQVAGLYEEIRTIQADIKSFAKKTEIKSLQAQYIILRGQIDKLNKEIKTIPTESTSFAKETDVSSLNGRVVELEEQVGKNHSDLENKLQELSQKINGFHNGTSAQDTSPETGKSRLFGKYIFICAILLFNILATSIIICCPRYLGEVDPLPWFGIILLIACLILNIVGSGIWLYEYYLSEEYIMKKGNIIFTIVVEGTLLVLNTVVMWLFASNPLQGITGASIALTVALVCANFAMLMLRVLYILDEHTFFDVTLDRSSLAMNICGALCAVATVIALIFATAA